jgi:hypothetical protein
MIAMWLPAFLAGQGSGIIVGIVIGCFIPSVGRWLKAKISGEAKVIGSKIGLK